MSALEFTAPLNVGASAFNRNARKFRILQVKFPDSESLEPILVGTYQVDPSTGQPIATQSFQNPLANISGNGSGASVTIFPAGSAVNQWRLDRLWISNLSAGCNADIENPGIVHAFNGLQTNNLYSFDFGTGISSLRMGLNIGSDLKVVFSGGATGTVNYLGYTN